MDDSSQMIKDRCKKNPVIEYSELIIVYLFLE
ncbi:hypothetical protein UAY_01940 [Enterococcus moraviensis ATCC BAA-383]|uniref:Uncharacterized protein n=1 Tax=Enterococcus moraviensis ATCC BAA-383 TaxID=1158609 RepID=R2QUZ1_9ENTE|nr:hypothetical protein UAY_01940 [Enterococcus moraviensis ATCC BAA-383]EOT72154.1 hypothetical protein I586_01962 [Enterococcus moraviensis ATCC BAA-383]